MDELTDFQENMKAEAEAFEEWLYQEAKNMGRRPCDSIRWLKKIKSELPDRYSGTIGEVINVGLTNRVIEDVIKRIREDALNVEWSNEDA